MGFEMQGRIQWGNQFLVKFNRAAPPLSLDKPLHTITTRDRFALVDVVNGRAFMRMLQPRELYRAHGFPDDYVIWPIVAGEKISRELSVEKVGNSVVVPMARRLVDAVLYGRGVEQPDQLCLPSCRV